jgi:hypothetical protein
LAVSDCGTGNPTTLPVEVFYEPEVDLGNDTSIYQGQSIVLDAGNPGSEYNWSTGATTQTITVDVSGTYAVTVENYCGSDFDEIEVSVIVGLPEIDREQPQVVVQSRQVVIRSKHEIEWFRAINPAGQIIYDGVYLDAYTLPAPGIYFIQLRVKDTYYTTKVAVL